MHQSMLSLSSVAKVVRIQSFTRGHDVQTHHKNVLYDVKVVDVITLFSSYQLFHSNNICASDSPEFMRLNLSV